MIHKHEVNKKWGMMRVHKISNVGNKISFKLISKLWLNDEYKKSTQELKQYRISSDEIVRIHFNFDFDILGQSPNYFESHPESL